MALPQLLPSAPAARPATGESPFFKSLVVLYGGLFVIGCVLTGVCFLIPYLVAGRAF